MGTTSTANHTSKFTPYLDSFMRTLECANASLIQYHFTDFHNHILHGWFPFDRWSERTFSLCCWIDDEVCNSSHHAPAGRCLTRFFFSVARSIQSDRATSRRPVDCLVTLTAIFATTLRYVHLVSRKPARLLTFLSPCSITICAASNVIVRWMSPGLHAPLYETVASQLRIMSPCILLAVRVGPTASTLSQIQVLVAFFPLTFALLSNSW